MTAQLVWNPARRPAFGSWIDLTIVLWVLVALVVSMLLYIAAWWRATSRT